MFVEGKVAGLATLWRRRPCQAVVLKYNMVYKIVMNL